MNQGNKEKNKEKKGKRRMVETKDGFEIHEVGKKAESDEEKGETTEANKREGKDGANEGLKGNMVFFGVLSDEED